MPEPIMCRRHYRLRQAGPDKESNGYDTFGSTTAYYRVDAA